MFLDPILPRSRGHRAATWAVVLFCAVLAIRGVPKGLRPGGNDFTVYYDAARTLLDGGDPLSVPGSIYLPSFSVALAPFAALPYLPALILWQSLGFLALLWGWRRSLELLGPPPLRREWVPWLALLAVSRLVDSSFAYSQVNTITFALVAEAVHRLRRGQTRSAALSVGLGAALKILPAGLCLWFLLRGAWRAAALSLLSIALFVFLPPIVVMGPQRAAASLENWRTQVLAPVERGGERLLQARDYVPGQSLTAVCYRVFSATPATSEGVRGPRANLFDWPLSTTHRLVQGLGAAHLLVWVLASWRRQPRPAAEPGFALEAGLCVAMILVLGPVVQKAHMLWLLLPYGVLMGIPSALRGYRARLRDGLLATSVVLVAGSAPALLGDALATRLLSANVIFLGLECCVGALLLELLGRRQITPSCE